MNVSHFGVNTESLDYLSSETNSSKGRPDLGAARNDHPSPKLKHDHTNVLCPHMGVHRGQLTDKIIRCA